MFKWRSSTIYHSGKQKGLKRIVGGQEVNKSFRDKNLKRKEQLHIMVSQDEKTEIERKAHIQGLTVSRYVRWLVTTDNSTSICDKKSVDF